MDETLQFHHLESQVKLVDVPAVFEGTEPDHVSSKLWNIEE